MEPAVMGHTNNSLSRPVSLLMVCHARWLELVKSINSTISVLLSLRLLSSLVKRSVAADTLSALDIASVWAHSRSSHWSSQYGMWLDLQPLRMYFLAASSIILQYTLYASSMLLAVVTGRVPAVTSTSLSLSRILASWPCGSSTCELVFRRSAE